MGKERIEKIILLDEMRRILSYCKSDESKKDFTEYYQDKVLSSNDDEVAYWFIQSIPNADIERLSNIIIDGKNPKYNYDLVMTYNSKKIKEHGQAVIDSKDPYYNLYVASIPGADVKGHGQVIIESKKVEYNFRFLQLPNSDIKAHEKFILDSNDYSYIATMAAKIPGVDIKACEEKLLEIRNIYYLCRYVLDMDIKRLNEYSTEEILDLILKSNNELHISNIYNERKDILKKMNKLQEYENFINQNCPKLIKKNEYSSYYTKNWK